MPGIGSSLLIASLFDRTIEAVATADTALLTQLISECADAKLPDSVEEFSRALTQRAALEKVLEETGRNLRLLRGEGRFRYWRR